MPLAKSQTTQTQTISNSPFSFWFGLYKHTHTHILQFMLQMQTMQGKQTLCISLTFISCSFCCCLSFLLDAFDFVLCVCRLCLFVINSERQDLLLRATRKYCICCRFCFKSSVGFAAAEVVWGTSKQSYGNESKLQWSAFLVRTRNLLPFFFFLCFSYLKTDNVYCQLFRSVLSNGARLSANLWTIYFGCMHFAICTGHFI